MIPPKDSESAILMIDFAKRRRILPEDGGSLTSIFTIGVEILHYGQNDNYFIDFSAAPSTAHLGHKLRAKGLFEMTVGNGRFQRLQVSFYVETRCYNSILGVLYRKMRDFSRGFLREKTGKDGH